VEKRGFVAAASCRHLFPSAARIMSEFATGHHVEQSPAPPALSAEGPTLQVSTVVPGTLSSTPVVASSTATQTAAPPTFLCAPPAPTAADDLPAALTARRTAVQSPEPTSLWLRRGDQLFVGVLLALGLPLLVVYGGRISGWGRPPVAVERSASSAYEVKLDINPASWIEWEQLDGIGETLAKRIVADREAHGPFGSIEELRRVKGIGAKTVERMRPWLKFGSDEGVAEGPGGR
jgi:competence protein ComEA